MAIGRAGPTWINSAALGGLAWERGHGTGNFAIPPEAGVEGQRLRDHRIGIGSSRFGKWMARNTGDYGATVELLLNAGAKAPEVTQDLEASEAAREALRRHAARPAS